MPVKLIYVVEPSCMSVEEIISSIKPKGDIKLFANKKEAEKIDKKVGCAYTLMEYLSAMPKNESNDNLFDSKKLEKVPEDVLENLCLALSFNSDSVVGILKGKPAS